MAGVETKERTEEVSSAPDMLWKAEKRRWGRRRGGEWKPQRKGQQGKGRGYVSRTVAWTGAVAKARGAASSGEVRHGCQGT